MSEPKPSRDIDISQSGAVDGVRSPAGANPERHRGTVLPDEAEENRRSPEPSTHGDDGGGNIYGRPTPSR